MKLTCFKMLYNIFQYKKILSTYFFLFLFLSFFWHFVVDFKISVKLSRAFFTLMPSITLSSLGPNSVSSKILIFRGDILKNVCQEIPSFLASIFPLCTLIPNSEFEKQLTKILVFSMQNAARKSNNGSINR